MGGDPTSTRLTDLSLSARLAIALSTIRADLGFALVDAVIVALAYLGALTLRFVDRGGVPDHWWNGLAIALPIIIVAHIGSNLAFGAYGHVWEFASVGEAMRIVGASAAAALGLLVGEMAYERYGSPDGAAFLPVIALLLGALLATGGMGAVRFRSRLFTLKRMGSVVQAPGADRTLVVGTGRAAADVARYGPSETNPFDVIGFVTTALGRRGKRLAGKPIIGTLGEIPVLVDELGIDQIIIAHSDAERVSREVVDRCLEIDVRLRMLPNADEVLAGPGGLVVRDLEFDDLLVRPTVETRLEDVAELLQDQVVMVTGAGGSIGSEIVSQVLAFGPQSVIALDHDETHLHDAAVGWGDHDRELVLELADVRDRDTVDRSFERYRPDVVFHAAAHKHVPILEEFPDEAVKTNVIGTRRVLDATARYAVDRFVLVSTDKAVDPTSVMGASKRVAEMMVQAAAHAELGDTDYASVRFGNVLGSRGSVVPTFMRQIEQGGPVTVSDPNMERFFMTNHEAVQLVLHTATLADHGEVFVLDMGEPVRIMDLAHRLIRLAGLVPNRDIEVVITGVRPGEKLIEALSAEELRPSAHTKIKIADATTPGPATLHDAVDLLEDLALDGDRDALRELLHGLARRRWDGDETVDLRHAIDGLHSRAG